MTAMVMAENGSGRDDSCFELPEGCIAYVVALTSPRDACRVSLVASIFRSAAGSDAVWERFLPADYEDILARAILDPESPPPASKKDLYLWLSDHPLLIDGGTKDADMLISFYLEKLSGRKCYMLAARDLTIVWGDTPRYWRWTSLPDCRFSEVAELVDVCWLEIRGKISTRMLSPNTTYAAFLVFKLTEGADGLEDLPTEVAMGISGRERKTQTAYVDPVAHHREGGNQYPKVREDGWMEVELGECFNKGGEERELEMSLMEVKHPHWKSGLIILGIDIRPKSFYLEKLSGRKCYMLAARDLAIVWGDTPRYWRWTSLPDCRFPEVAELVDVCWLEIRGKIATRMLSPNTTYAAFLVFKLTRRAYGLEYPPAEVAMGISGLLQTQIAYVYPVAHHREGGNQYPKVREDGWMEVELGEYFNEGGEERELEMSVMEVKGGNWKSGLIIQGIDIRPKVGQ